MPVLATVDRVQTPTDRSPANTLEGPGSVRWSQGAPVGQLPPQMSHPMPGPVPPSMMPPPGSLPPGTMIAPNGQLIASGPMPPPHLHRSISQPMGHMDHAMGRHPSFIGQPEYKIFELNRRLHQRTEESDNLWWDAFTNEFFEDDATLTLVFCLEDGLKRYTIGRTLIPRYFRSVFEGGVTEMQICLRHAKDSLHGQQTIALDCEHAAMVTQHGKPFYTKVISEGRMLLEFAFDESMRIRSWHFTTKMHREMLPRSAISTQDTAMIEQLSKNITRQGLTNYTLNFLRLCVILEPMQELMSRHKAYGLTPRDCLKTTLFQKWQRMVAPPGKQKQYQPPLQLGRPSNGRHPHITTPAIPSSTMNYGSGAGQNNRDAKTARQPNKRRKRKSNTPASTTNTPPGIKQKRSPMQCPSMMGGMPGPPNLMGGPPPPHLPQVMPQMMPGFVIASGAVSSDPMGTSPNQRATPGGSGFGDVMVVGEPTLMGGEFGDEDERVITRLENAAQLDGSAAAAVSALNGVSSIPVLPPLMPPARMLAEQHPDLCLSDDIKDPKLKSGHFPSPSSIDIGSDPLANLTADQWPDNKIIDGTSDITNVIIKTE